MKRFKKQNNLKKAQKPMTLQEAKELFPAYRYAVCDWKSGLPLFLCNDLEEGKQQVKDNFMYGGKICEVVDLRAPIAKKEKNKI